MIDFLPKHAETIRPIKLIQLAHDVLHAVAAREIDIGLTEQQRQKVHAVHDALSWVLQGACGDDFQKVLSEMMHEAKRRGYHLRPVV